MFLVTVVLFFFENKYALAIFYANKESIPFVSFCITLKNVLFVWFWRINIHQFCTLLQKQPLARPIRCFIAEFHAYCTLVFSSNAVLNKNLQFFLNKKEIFFWLLQDSLTSELKTK